MPKTAAILLCHLLALLVTPASSQTGCFPAYSTGASYSSGDIVSKATTSTSTSTVPCATPGSNGCDVNGFQTTTTTTTTTYNYRCTNGLFGAYCKNAVYAPGSVHGSLAWVRDSSECVGSAATDAPSPSPTPEKWSGGGCPEGYAVGTEYQAGDVVSANAGTYRMVYKVRPEARCSLPRLYLRMIVSQNANLLSPVQERAYKHLLRRAGLRSSRGAALEVRLGGNGIVHVSCPCPASSLRLFHKLTPSFALPPDWIVHARIIIQRYDCANRQSGLCLLGRYGRLSRCVDSCRRLHGSGGPVLRGGRQGLGRRTRVRVSRVASECLLRADFVS